MEDSVFSFQYKETPNGYLGQFSIYCDYPEGYFNRKYFEVISHTLPPLCMAAQKIGNMKLRHVKAQSVTDIVYQAFRESGIIGF